MFYSQFILAKKGPLGTIWIAAHLERKLRKNQVADTDIGVSVDSILCPEVPIALRLSSHLLLGVVRIYSRKVNYLFDDCSEALLKIKQAFRSTAVDLPPEESKAPYHSITLPETFDLDDFELPDNDIFQGNYVDHHTSTREQITLQDNMEGVVFSTSQFGLDERFGDGEAPGLNLDEELFLHKVDNAGHAGESADHQSSAQAATPKPDEGYGGILSNPETRIGNLNLEGDLMDYAQAPCTPGLVETPNLANIQEISACEDHMDDEDNPLTEPFVNGNSENISSEFSHREENAPVVVLSSTDNTNSIAAADMLGVENGNHLSELETEKRHSPLGDGSLHMSSSDPLSPSGKSFAVDDNAQALGQDPKLTGMTMPGSICLVRTQELENVILKNADVNHPSVSNMNHGELNGIISKEISGDASCSISLMQVPEGISDDHQTAPFGDKSKDMEVSGSPCRQIFSNGKLELSVEDQYLSSLEMPWDNSMSNVAICDETTQVHILRPCIGLGLPDSSVPRAEVSNDLDTATDVGAVPLESSGGGEMIHASGPAIVIQDDKLEHDLMENHTTEPISVEDSHAVPGKLDNQVNNVIGGDDMMENISSPVSAVFPAPEKLLSVPDEHNNNQPRDLLLEATPGDLACVDESDAGSRIISGKKRSYTESTLTEQSLNSVESARIVRTKRTAEAIPDDDDLLSSILVGRRSSVLKVKPTPPPSEITSTKRQRQAPRASASKRKVLMDDTMVLHGDTIRQQLTTTEDIRRLRKKAPCTRPEISIIMKQFLEEEIFSEPLFSGVSVALASLFNQGCDLSRIKISKGDAGAVSLLSSSDVKSISANETIENATGCAPAVPVENDVGDCGELAAVKENFDLQPAETTLPTENKLDETHELCTEPIITEPEIIPVENKEEAVDPNSSLLSPSHNFGENEIGDTSAPSEAVGVAQLTTPNKGVGSDDLVEMEATVVSSGDIREAENVMLDAPVVNGSEMNVNDERFDTVKSGNTDAATEVEPKERDGFVLEGTLCADTVETERYVGEQVQADVCGPSGENEEEQAEACGPSGEKEQPQAEACGPSGENEQSQPEACGPSGENELVQSEACGPSVENEQVQSEICGPSTGEIETDTSRRDYSEPLCGGSPGGPQLVTPLYPSEFGGVQGSFLDDNEYLIRHEGYPPHVVGADIDMQDYNDFNYSAAANDTEFLNVDDDEVAEVTDDYVPDADETRFMEKSGWSSRTRAVANYLQTMFLKEAEYDRKVLPMDNLLSGKTRKEASRMFFETLVLKTRDYIHVEQECPHQNINIKPKMKLLKTEF